MANENEALEIIIDRLIPGTPELVFKALTEPALYSRWMGPAGSETEVDEMDVRPGGRLAFRVRIPGGPEFALGGTYMEVDPPRRLAHTWAMAGEPETTTVTIELRAERGETRIVLAHVGFEELADLEQNDAGWQHQLDRLAQLLLEAEVLDTR